MWELYFILVILGGDSVAVLQHLLHHFYFLHKVADADDTVKNLEKEADRLMDKLKPIKQLQDNLGKNISQIKELINQARKQANSVRHFLYVLSILCVCFFNCVSFHPYQMKMNKHTSE